MNAFNQWQDLFVDFDDQIWLNAASEGPLPKPAIAALSQAIKWKSQPYHLDTSKFTQTVVQTKQSIAKLIDKPWQDVILANSATYGIQLLVNGLDLKSGDEVLVMQNDFPTDILPWLTLETKGVVIHQLKGQGAVIAPHDLEERLTPRSKVVCLPHVHTFSGERLDIDAFITVCKKHQLIFIVNVSQSLATMPLDFDMAGIDALVTAGYKWICGPYGTGFAWIRPELRNTLQNQPTYWISDLSVEQLESTGPLVWTPKQGARYYDVYGTANFFNFIPLKASIDMLLGIGVDQIWQHIDQWLEEFLRQLDDRRYHILSPRQPQQRSGSLYLSLDDPQKNQRLHKALTDAGIHTAFWKGNIRISPHIYNNINDLESLICFLNTFE